MLTWYPKLVRLKKITRISRSIFFGSFEGDDIDHTWDQVAQAAGIGHETNVGKIINSVGVYNFREATKKKLIPDIWLKIQQNLMIA